MKIFVTRHGQTDWNAMQKIQGQSDIELNQEGIKQARETGENIKGEKIDLIISSPLKRALKTAEIINESFNAPIIKDERLMERSYGKNEGLTKTQIRELREKYSEIYDVWDYDKNIDFEGLEKMHDFCNRVYGFLDEVTDKYKDQNLLLVTHGGTSLPIQCYFKNIPLNQISNRDIVRGLKNCEVAVFESNRENQIDR